MGRPGVIVLVLMVHVAVLPQNTQGVYFSLNSKFLAAMQSEVENEFFTLLLDDLVTTNDSITYTASQLETCNLDIENQKTQCLDCVRVSCEERIDRLQCGVQAVAAVEEVALTSTKLECIIFPPLCQLKEVTNKVAKAIKKVGDQAKKVIKSIGKRVKKIGKVVKKIGEGVKKIVKGAGKVVKKAGEAIKKGVKKIAEGAKKTAKKIADGAKKVIEGVKKVVKKVAEGAKKVVKKIAEGAKKVVKKITGGVKKVVKKVTKPVKKIIRRIRRIFRVRSWGRRKRQSEPTCEQFENNENACSYYRSQCQACSIFGTPGSVVEFEDVIAEVCGQEVLAGYLNLDNLIERIEKLGDVINTFVLTGVLFDPVSYTDVGYTLAQAKYAVGNQNITVQLTQPIIPHDETTTAPVIAKDIYDQLFPAAA